MRCNVNSDVADGSDKNPVGSVLIPTRASHFGLVFATIIFISWFCSLAVLLLFALKWPWWAVAFGILLQTHLYTGIFITLHDSVHGSITPNRRLNQAIGYFYAKIFAFNNYKRLTRLHHLHHQHVATEEDPDFSDNQNFVIWYFKFVLEYVDLWQILFMAIAFNILKLWFPYEALILFWILPAILSTFQLFYFGTYLPHRHPEDLPLPARSRSMALSHVRAFFACYFFGYHKEHHMAPYLPWWKLARAKEEVQKGGLW